MQVSANEHPHSGNGTDAVQPTIPGEEVFRAMLMLERRRSERSRKPFILMLLDAPHENGTARGILHQALAVLVSSTRETDAFGWYKDGMILGSIFIDVGDGDQNLVGDILRTRVRTNLQEQLGRETSEKIAISLHLFPEHWDRDDSGWRANSALYPELRSQARRQSVTRAIKRAIDIAGSATLLLLLLPVLATIAVIIKLTSKGPVLFEQERLGQWGVRFNCLKFRTMYVNNDSNIHKAYVRELISVKTAKTTDIEEQKPEAPTVYKIVGDPRVTPVGRFLRKTSLDELPQFWNVVRNDMSLVGPRPPVPYEFEMYQYWHRRRVLEVKPGVTGLWQVSGRSRIGFDDMVRLDLRYCESWSLWLDLKILLATPRAAFSGTGAY